tara:strand:+ start:2941 stop:3336 length:396 start_codon:yes stop_codon:yes gene_type:complete
MTSGEYINTRAITLSFYILTLSVILGYLSDLLFLFPSEIWIVWFISHISILSLMTLLGEKDVIVMYDRDRFAYLFLNVATALWYINRLNLSTSKSGGYVNDCNVELLLISNVSAVYILLFSIISIFISFIF